ncbi:MAG TPA: universal stress protein, partial [Candidatus Binatia bacterium]|nr:universal stress protein [Candidatus Binatia bacterium]
GERREGGVLHDLGLPGQARNDRVPCTLLVTNVVTAYEGIVDVAKKRKCDVIFMASHGRRGLSKLMMGSVTQKVLTHSKIPVVVYR